MTTAGATGNRPTSTTSGTQRVSTETKSAFKTTELMAYIGGVIAVIITAIAVGDGGDGGPDPFSALDAIRYITYLTIGYMVARGLAKVGSRDYYDRDRPDRYDR
jgi:hypothetical protein